MFSYTTQDAVDCFINAKNLNASLKKIVKSEASKDPRTARFTKALKIAMKSPKDDAIPAFVEKALPDYTEHLFLVVRNAYAPLIEPILDAIITEYADNFNETYSIDPTSGVITVSSEDSFKQLGKQAIDSLVSQIDSAELPSNGFMKKAILYSLFDRSVLEELEKHLSA